MVVAGGYFNSIADQSSGALIAGGINNIVGTNSDYSTVAGGYANSIGEQCFYATIAGGGSCTIGTNCDASTIGGGAANQVAHNTGHGTIAGGINNILGTNSGYSSIGGGYNNIVASNATYAAIPGGYMNFATNAAFAAGTRAKARHSGAFVWGDNYTADIASTNANSVTMRAGGGYRFFSSSAATVGVSLAPGSGTFTAMSDRNSKQRFEPVDAQAVLAKVAALPLSTWQYKSQDASVRHIGPMAQDFKAAFAVGESDTGITTIDADGVALAAIQGLNQKLAEALKQKHNEIAELKHRLEMLERRMNQNSIGERE